MERIGSIEGDGILRIDAARLVDTRVLIQGSSGSGKSWLIRLLVEKVAAKIPVLILDLEGEFVTLREKFDFVVAGEGGEVSVDVRSAGLLARKLLELKLSGVVSLYDLTMQQRRLYVRAFLESIMAAPRSLWAPRLIVLDEAHVFAPEGSQAESLGAVIDVASRGRKRGYCLVSATQRLSKLHKDVAAEMRNVFVGQTTLDVDVKRALDTLGFPADLEHKRDLRSLDHQFYAMGPATSAEGVVLFKADNVKTTHPESGLRRSLSPPEPSKRIKQALGELTDLPKQAEEEAKTMADAKRQIAELQRQLKAKPMPVQVVDEKAAERAAQKAAAEERKKWELIVSAAESTIKKQRGQLDQIAALAAKNGELVKLERPPAVNNPVHKSHPVLPHRAVSPAAPTVATTRNRDATGENSGSVSNRQQRFLDAAAALSALGADVTRDTVAGWVGVHPRGGSVGEELKALVDAGLIEMDRGRITVTEAGTAAAGYVDPSQAIERAKAGLTNRQAKFFELIIAAYPEATTREAIAEHFQIHPRGGSLGEDLGRLVGRGLVEGSRGQYRARDFLFAGTH